MVLNFGKVAGNKPAILLKSWRYNIRIYGELILNGRTNDQIILRWERSFINDKCIFQ